MTVEKAVEISTKHNRVRCPECKFIIRGKNHTNGAHHKKKVPRLNSKTG